MHEDLKKLCDLQDLLTTIRDARQQIDDTPRLVEEIEAVRKRSEQELETAQHNLEEAQKLRRHLEAELADLEQKISRYQDQVFQVKKNEEYQALMKEIAAAKEEIKRTEDGILEQMERIEEEQVKVRDRDRSSQHVRVECEQKIGDVLQEKERLVDELKRFEFERKRLEESIGPQLLARFEKIAAVRDGIAVSRVVDESCQLCCVRVRPQAYQDLKMGTGLVQCGSCHRFLYLGEETDKEQGGA